MKKLLLIRHAKSSWKDDSIEDHERPLNKRGERDIITMARYFADKDELLDVIYSSTAIRALEYAQMLSEFTNTTLIPDLSFYTFRNEDLLEIIRHLPENATNVAIVGHNPAITQVVNQLSGEEIKNVPTSGVVALDCDVERWDDLIDGQISCFLSYFDYPKMFD